MRKVGCFGLVLCLAAIVALFLVVQSWGGAGPAPRTLTVQIGDGSTLAGAATELEKAGAIPSARRFRLSQPRGGCWSSARSRIRPSRPGT